VALEFLVISRAVLAAGDIATEAQESGGRIPISGGIEDVLRGAAGGGLIERERGDLGHVRDANRAVKGRHAGLGVGVVPLRGTIDRADLVVAGGAALGAELHTLPEVDLVGRKSDLVQTVVTDRVGAVLASRGVPAPVGDRLHENRVVAV